MKNENYFQVQGWMINELKLSGNELITYAVIYGFSQDGKTRFTGSLDYLAGWLSSSRDTARRALNQLIDRQLVTKNDVHYKGSVKYCEYYVDLTRLKISTYGAENKPGDEAENKPGTELKISTNNNIYNNKNNNIYNMSKKFTKPTIEEIAAYIKEKKYQVDAETFWNFYESKGWLVGKSPMKNWKAAVATWQKNNNTKRYKGSGAQLPDYDKMESQIKVTREEAEEALRRRHKLLSKNDNCVNDSSVDF